MTVLKTFMQVSDLHFAGPLQRRLYDPIAHKFPYFDGLVGHDPAVLGYVQATYEQLGATEPDLELIVTGDLTAQGIDSEFDDAIEYLGSKRALFPFDGLGAADWLVRSVPGNHDHWPGKPFAFLGGPNARVGALFPQDASITPSMTLPNGKQLVFLLLNGDADVGPWSWGRALARGSFASAVHKMKGLLAHRNAADEVRVLLLHHSVQYPGGVPIYVPFLANLVRPLTIDDASRTAIEALIATHGVRVVLTGHVHDPFFVGDLHAAQGGAALNAMEARCGTTTQRARHALNALFVHRIEQDDNGALWWNSALYVHRSSGKPEFEDAGPVFAGRAAAHRMAL
jgi:Calcineurin-like phosphoesterase